MTKPKTDFDKLIETLRRSRAIGIQPGVPKPEDPREFGRRAAREIFEQYITPGESVIQRAQGD